MIRVLSRPIPLALFLALCTLIPVLMSVVLVVQIPFGAVPEDNLRLYRAPVSYFLHAIAGGLFGVLGPLQFVQAVRKRLGAWHRILGRIFVLAGAGLGLSGLVLILQVESIATGLLDSARWFLGQALIVSLVHAVAAARDHDMLRHRTWMIRAYAIGMGQSTAALVLFPIYLVTGKPPAGLGVDFVVVSMWLLNIALAEGVARRLAAPNPMKPALAPTTAELNVD